MAYDLQVESSGRRPRWGQSTGLSSTVVDEVEVLKIATEHPLLSALDRRILESVVRASRTVNYRAKRTLLKQGDPASQVYCLLRGSVRAFHRSDDGNEVLVRLFRSPASFGEMEVLAARPFVEYATTLEPSTIMEIPADIFMKLVTTQPKFSQAMAIDLASRLCISTHNEKSLAFCDVDTRLANLLLDYAEFFGTRSEKGVRLNVSLSQESMARDIAVSRKSLTRALQKLKKGGVVGKHNARYVIHDLDALKLRSSDTIGLVYQTPPAS